MSVLLIGYSGHGHVAYDILKAMGKEIIGYCDSEEKEFNPVGLEYFGLETDPEVLKKIKNYDCFIGIGKNELRRKVFEHLTKQDIRIINAIHPSAVVSSSAKLGKGVMVAQNAVINAHSSIGDGTICNTGSIVEHDCTIHKFSHIAPGTVICGTVIVGENSLVGANAVVKLYTTIGENVKIAEGSVVVKDIPDNQVVIGNNIKSDARD